MRDPRLIEMRLLRMVRLAAKVCVHQTRTFRMRGSRPRSTECDKHRIYIPQKFGIIAFKNPSALSFIIRKKDSESLRALILAFLFCPHLVLIIGFLDFLLIQVVGVKDK